ncbi:coiled-coil domain-containing protein 112-like [Sitophilus oryzae]|uniref:Coiled-coil domain-containing protein 112-like n=1 Tax=Sitophilus oryzae TaxID=7048 RepID=A0A6J2XMN7_SITOR|nr:coiled-coil domain-containing protein 112-like [Sitophilus oryzae]
MNIISNSDLNKLYQIEETLEKSIKSIIGKFESTQNFTADIIENFKQSNELRQKELLESRKKTRETLELLKAKQALLKNKEIQKINDFNKFKNVMVQIHENIINMKENAKETYNGLNDIAEDLYDELTMYYYGKLVEWNENSNITSNYECIPAKIKNKKLGQCKEVKKFLDFVYKSGGHENRWRKEDHLLFLKYKARYKNIEDVALNLHDTLPDISIDDIKLHDQWYKEYVDLKLKKKRAIALWKQGKNKKSNIVNNVEHNSCNEKEDIAANTGENLREKLQQWKLEKEQELQLEKEAQLRRMAEKIEKERLERLKQLEIKQIVNEWKESKLAYKKTEELSKRNHEELEKKRRAMEANKLIKQFQSMDELHILKMRQAHQKNSAKTIQRVRSGPASLRDPERLLKPTVVWAHRVKSINEPSVTTLSVLSTSKLAIPNWRKNIT